MKKVALYFILAYFALHLMGEKADARGLAPLISPYPILTQLPNNITITKEKPQCGTPPNTVRDMMYNSVYTDRTSGVSIVDEKAKKKYKTAIADIIKFERKITKWVSHGLYGDGDSERSIKCALEWMSIWANNRSMLGGKTNFQGEAMRKWTLGVISSHYIQIKYLAGLNKNQKKDIEKWLKRLGKAVIHDYKQHPESKSRQNNHMYWAAWGVMITGIAVENTEFYKWSGREYKKGVKQIQEDGLLPHEVFREGKAFNYHVFAAAPLVMMAETMTRNGHDMYEYHNGAIHRLVRRITEDLDTNQAYIEQITGVEQDLKGTINSGMLAWLEVYNTRYNNDKIDPWLKKFRPMIQRRIGGNMTHIFAQNSIQDTDKSAP